MMLIPVVCEYKLQSKDDEGVERLELTTHLLGNHDGEGSQRGAISLTRQSRSFISHKLFLRLII